MDAMGASGVADRVMNVLEGRGPRTFEDLFLDLPDLNWLQLSVVLEKLVRDGDIAIWQTEDGDYRISAQSSQLTH
jgi:hypothetical protein